MYQSLFCDPLESVYCQKHYTMTEKCYYTHFNGNRPYCVKVVFQTETDIDKNGWVNAKTVSVHKTELYQNTSVTQPNSKVCETCGWTFAPLPEVILEYANVNVWIGRTSPNKTRYSVRDDKLLDGNSVLIQCPNDLSRYIFVGEKFFGFSTCQNAPIKTFVSPMGRSDVPYPYAIDKDARYYLFLQQRVLMDCSKHPASKEPTFEPYDYLYANAPFQFEAVDEILHDIWYTPEFDAKKAQKEYEYQVSFLPDGTDVETMYDPKPDSCSPKIRPHTRRQDPTPVPSDALLRRVWHEEASSRINHRTDMTRADLQHAKFWNAAEEDDPLQVLSEPQHPMTFEQIDKLVKYVVEARGGIEKMATFEPKI